MQEILLDAISNGGTGSGTGLGSLSWSHTIGRGQHPILLVGIGCEVAIVNAGNMVITGITFNGVALTKKDGVTIAGQGSDSKYQRTELWFLPPNSMPAPGTYTITATFTGNVDYPLGEAVTFFNVKQSGPEAYTTQSLNGNVTITTSVTTLTQNAVVVDFLASQNGTTFLPADYGAGQIEIGNPINSNHGCVMSYKRTTNPGSTSMTQRGANPESQSHIVVSLPFLGAPSGGLM